MGRLTTAISEQDRLWRDGDQGLVFDPNDGSSGTATFLADAPAFFRRIEQESFGCDDGTPEQAMALFARAAAAPADPDRAMVALRDHGGQEWRDLLASGISGLRAGAVIHTDKGEYPIEDIQAGQRVLTRDHGFQTVVWTGQRDLGTDDGADELDVGAVVIEAGALGPNMPTQRMVMSQHQCLLVEGPRTKLLFGEREVFVPAGHLVGYPGISLATTAPAAFIYIMCEAHEVIWLDGIWTESFRSGRVDDTMEDARQDDDFASVSEENAVRLVSPAMARRILKRHEADILLA
ncbi:MAG: Hint domain-containing protein [Paracoccaceae bacterium]